MRQSRRFSSRGFTLIELLVASIIFVIGFTGAYMLVHSSLGLASAQRNEIIASNILREQHELMKNIRDSNWIQLRNWDSIERYVPAGAGSGLTLTPGYYVVENDYSGGSHAPVRLVRLPSAFDGTQASVLADTQSPTPTVALCIDSAGRYVHSCTAGQKRTPYAAFFKVENVITRGAGSPVTVANAWRYTFSFTSTDGVYRRYDLSAILTDWKH